MISCVALMAQAAARRNDRKGVTIDAHQSKTGWDGGGL